MNDASQQPPAPPQPAFEAAKTDVQRKTLDQRELANELMRLRHSCAHILATAVLRLWPDARLDIGPATEDGFYYDFDLSTASRPTTSRRSRRRCARSPRRTRSSRNR